MLGKQWDVVVIGAGVAGAAFATLAASRGMSVLLAESKRFPREKVCGGCLNRRAQASLQSLGLLSSLVDASAVPIPALHIRVANQSSVWSVPSMLSVRRSTLDWLLVQKAIEKGATYLGECKASIQPVLLESKSTDSRNLRTTHLQVTEPSGVQELEVQSRSIVVATGLTRSALPRTESWPVTQMAASRIGVHALVPDSEMSIAPQLTENAKRSDAILHMLVGQNGYVGICRTDGNMWDFAAAIDPSHVKSLGGVVPSVQAILRENGFNETEFLHRFEWQATPFLTRRSNIVAQNGVFLLGDAIGYVEPFTGEGMSWAFAGAESLNSIFDQSLASSGFKAEGEWNSWANTKMQARRRASEWVARQSRNLGRAKWVLKACDWIPPIKHFLLKKIMT